ncbi:MAG: chorismate-binding protein [Paramuribaculum sp.]|nr:chorismate-binding protein [Paramuribaculum sp.]
MTEHDDMFSEELQKAAKKCLTLNYPFAIVLMPGGRKPLFFASDSADDSPVYAGGYFLPGFAASFFGDHPEMAAYIAPKFTVEDVLNLPDDATPLPVSTEPFPSASTDFMTYYAIVRELVAEHRRDNAKTVISRVIRFQTSVPVMTVASRYFRKMTRTFRFLYFTPQTGLWLGATPELLYEWTASTGAFRTMSLAGTRKKSIGSDKPEWDDKNRKEHDYVTDFIHDAFSELGVKHTVMTGNSLSFGNLEHICDMIDGTTDVPPAKVIDKLDPTPAVAGFPIGDAAQRIIYYEPHDRLCYSGFVSVTDKKKTSVYVNLRSAVVRPHADGSYDYAIFAGGGITKSSNPIDEWKEAASKASFLYRAANEGNVLPHPSLKELAETPLDENSDKIRLAKP